MKRHTLIIVAAFVLTLTLFATGCSPTQQQKVCPPLQEAYNRAENVVITAEAQIAALPSNSPLAPQLLQTLRQLQSYAWIAQDALLLVCPHADQNLPQKAQITTPK